MGLGNRTYWRDDQSSAWDRPSRGSSIFGGMPKPGHVVKYLLIANLVVFVCQLIFQAVTKVSASFYLGASVAAWWQIWRYVTFQFLHSTGDFFHLALNMLALYMVAGLTYVIASAAILPEWLWWMPLVGASGGVYGILLAAAVLFPHMQLILLLFPVPIRLAVLIVFIAMVLPILAGLGNLEQAPAMANFWSQVAHFGGVAAAAVWIWIVPRVREASSEAVEKMNEGAWKRKMQKRVLRQAEIDRILQKIKDKGLNSLSRKERKTLQDETRRQQTEENKLYK